jgi:hypothetical protein
LNFVISSATKTSVISYMNCAGNTVVAGAGPDGPAIAKTGTTRDEDIVKQTPSAIAAPIAIACDPTIPNDARLVINIAVKLEGSKDTALAVPVPVPTPGDTPTSTNEGIVLHIPVLIAIHMLKLLAPTRPLEAIEEKMAEAMAGGVTPIGGEAPPTTPAPTVPAATTDIVAGSRN